MISRILFQGDSITDADRSREENLPLGKGLGTGYPHLAASRLITDDPGRPWVIWNRGISGNHVPALYGRWEKDALDLKPDLISILIGINDTNRKFGVEISRFEQVYSDLLSWTKKALPETEMVLMEPFCFCFGEVDEAREKDVKERGKIVKKLAEEFHALFLPCQSILDKALERAPKEFWLRDGMHPNPAGHQLLADAWLAAAKDLLGLSR